MSKGRCHQEFADRDEENDQKMLGSDRHDFGDQRWHPLLTNGFDPLRAGSPLFRTGAFAVVMTVTPLS
jgi:hypothetical protein